RLRAKLAKLEEILEKQRWTQREQSVKYQETMESLRDKIDVLLRELEESKFSEQYKMEEISGYRKVLDSMAEPIYVVYQTDEIVPFNRPARAIGKMPALYSFMSKSKRGASFEAIEIIHSPDREPVTFTASIRPLRDAEGKVIGAVAVLRPAL